MNKKLSVIVSIHKDLWGDYTPSDDDINRFINCVTYELSDYDVTFDDTLQTYQFKSSDFSLDSDEAGIVDALLCLAWQRFCN